MSMLFAMLSITSKQADFIRANQSLANDLAQVAWDDAWEIVTRKMIEQLPLERRLQAEERDQEMRQSPESREAREELEHARQRLSGLGPLEPALILDKSWHILHYTFTRDIGPIGSPGDALLIGEEVGGDMGYGPPRILNIPEVRAFADFLSVQTIRDLQERLNYDAMANAGVYSLPMGQGAKADYERDMRRELATYYPLLQNYVAEAAAKRNGLLMWLT